MQESRSQQPARFTDGKRKPRWGTLVLVALLHLAALFGLARAFAPDFTAQVIERATSLVTVTIYTPPPATPDPDASPMPDEGAAGDEGEKAKARDISAPPNLPVKPTPLPRAASTGDANASGAGVAGEGTGAGGPGDGTGSGRGGQGGGGIPVSRPVKISGDINSARDFPVPKGGRQVRFGQEVIVYMTVGTDGRASNCRVVKASIDPEADRIVCKLAVQRFRFKPAIDANGNPVAADYGWKQWWKAAEG